MVVRGFVVAGLTLVLATEASASAPIDFNRDVRPVLAENCFACHGQDGDSREADLRLDLRDSAIESGAIEPGDPDASELVARIVTDDADIVMPPPDSHKSLTPDEREMLVRWVAEGAEYAKHWAFVPPVKKQPPAISIDDPWQKNPIDAFVLDRLREQGLAPAPPADSRSLFRRLSFDITGLPPSIQDTSDFVEDFAKRDDAAVSDAIDRLMQKQGWGEHRARYWLDAARYADTHGMHRDNYREIWPYRDWVIRSFNANQPFDQFTIEQLAGDLLLSPTIDQLTATGFQRCSMTTNEGGTIADENMAAYASDRVQTFGWVYLGLTTNCAQCHDHKFDPISAKDYYALAAYFRNTTQPAMDTDQKDGGGPFVAIPSAEDIPRWEVIDAELETASEQRQTRQSASTDEFVKWESTLTPQSFRDNVAADPIVQLPLHDEAEENQRESFAKLKWTADDRFGTAAQFKAKQNVSLGSLGDFAIDQPFSVATWFRSDNPHSGGAGLVAKMDLENHYRGWDVFLAGGKMAMHLIDRWPDAAIKVTTKDRVVEKDRWHHVCITYDGSATAAGIQIYMDGKKQLTTVDMETIAPEGKKSDDSDSEKAAVNIQTETPLRVGQRSTGDVHNGSIRDVYLFDRELSSEQAEDLGISDQLATIISIAKGDRSEKQQAMLQEHFLNRHDAEFNRLSALIADLEAERQSIRDRSPISLVQAERSGQPAMANILMRGDYTMIGDQVAAAPPESLHPIADDAPQNRLGLAMWTVDPTNPLTPRVTVNRFWQEIFGSGIVTTTEDFGVMGSPPSHPELLDWLAIDFVENGWDVKRFFKQILMSATYRQAAVTTDEKREKDRDNFLLSRGPRFRMDAEVIRDSALAASGLLSRKMFGPGTRPYQPDNLWNMVGLGGSNTRDYQVDEGAELYRRSIYTFWKRMSPPPGLEAFNAPNREVCTVRRERTNTPLQALVTLNAPEYIEAARNLAQNSLSQTVDSNETIERIALTVLSRALRPDETLVVMANHAAYVEHFSANPNDAKRLIAVGDSVADASISSTTLAAWTMTCNEILNLDETLNK
ncbi:Planctomycete cytochrome C [Rubripirellula tenax]|uniref:Planctomycete cytochrome C n=1 Tax=Rubripirellula tenax TaxID=2528015 RepID=A0A5C6FEM1_9BACT|nr:Planctomycete cytochrome C [Rubripirellula tenax]